MKASIHPNYVESIVRCACGNEFTTRSTLPQMRVELCSRCHPFYTGEQRLVDTAGRVDRFNRRYAKAAAPEAPTATALTATASAAKTPATKAPAAKRAAKVSAAP